MRYPRQIEDLIEFWSMMRDAAEASGDMIGGCWARRNIFCLKQFSQEAPCQLPYGGTDTSLWYRG